MPKDFGKAKSRIGGAIGLVKAIKGFSEAEILKEAERPFSLALIGEDEAIDLLERRLSREGQEIGDRPGGPANIRPYITRHRYADEAPSGAILLDADRLAESEVLVAQTLANIVLARKEMSLSLARAIPAFRPAVASQIIAEVSWTNTKVALVSALPGLVPMMDLLLPATSIGDMAILTRNQAQMLLRLAAAYGLPVNLKARIREVLPVVGGAFGWRAVAREIIGMVPGGIGLVVKGAIAYAGTYSVGKAAAIYYSTGQLISGPRLKQLYGDAYKFALSRVKRMIRRGKNAEPETASPDAQSVSELDSF